MKVRKCALYTPYPFIFMHCVHVIAGFTLHRFGLGNALPKIQLPNFFLPPQELEQTMRQLKMTALTRPPPRGLDHSASDSHKEFQQPNTVSERTRPDLSLQDMQRVARIFASKPS